MRNTAAYYLLLLYITAILRPLLPIASDAWNHAFAEAEHIATVHAKYGANHLEKELAAGSSESNKNQNTVKGQEQSSVHLAVNILIYKSIRVSPSNHYNLFNQHKLLTACPTNLAPPPKPLLQIS